MATERNPATKDEQPKKFTCADCGDTEVDRQQAIATFDKHDRVLCAVCHAKEEGREPPKPEAKITFLKISEDGSHLYTIPAEHGCPEGMIYKGFERVSPRSKHVLEVFMRPDGHPIPGIEIPANPMDERLNPAKTPRKGVSQPEGWQAKEDAKDMARRSTPPEAPAPAPQAPAPQPEPEPQEAPKAPASKQPAPEPQAPAPQPEPQHTRTAAVTVAPPEALMFTEAPVLDIGMIKQYINPELTDQEAYSFMMLCKYRRLNPFTKEVYAIKYKAKPGQPQKPAEMVVGKDTFTARAEAHPAFDGYEAGIIVRTKDGAIDRRQGTFYLKQEEALLGGWAKVYRTDRSRPIVAEVSMAEYNKGLSTWTQIPATMIRKVALVQGLREAFPSILGGLYDRAEMESEYTTTIDVTNYTQEA